MGRPNLTSASMPFLGCPSHIPFKRGDPERKRMILELFSGQPPLGATAIARIVGGSDTSVRKVINADKMKKAAECAAAQAGSEGKKWYECVADREIAECISSLAASNEIPELSTNIADTATVRDITEEELRMHTYPHTISKHDTEEEKERKVNAGRTWMSERLANRPLPKHQGFVIFPPCPDTNYDVVDKQLPVLLDEKNYQKLLLSIFQLVQGRGGDSSMGDKKRKQAKMSSVLELAERRLKEAKTAYKSFKKESDKRDKAGQKLREIEAENVLVHMVIDNMCDTFNRVQEVSHVLLWFVVAFQFVQLNRNLMHRRSGHQHTICRNELERQMVSPVWNRSLVLKLRDFTATQPNLAQQE